ncbi:MAG: hypothetical protein WEC16_01225 [Anaerolineales bacterium]
MKISFDDIKVFLNDIHIAIEERPLYYLLILGAYSLITLIVTFSQFFLILGNLSDAQKMVGLLIVITLMMGWNMVLVGLNKYLRREMDGRTELIQKAANLEEPKYRFSDWKEHHRISESGDVEWTRRVFIEYVDRPITWYKFFFGRSAASSGELKTHKLRFRAINLPENRPLSKVITEETPDRAQFAVILNPTLDVSTPTCGIELSLNWLGIWRDLVTRGEDFGTIRVDNETANLELSLSLPKGYHFTDFDLVPNITKPIYNEDKTQVEIQVKDPRQIEYKYYVKAKKD